MNQPQAPKTFFRKTDLTFIGIILAIAVGLFAFWQLNKTTGATAQVTVGLTPSGQTVTSYALNKNQVIHIDTADLPVQLEVLDGKIRFINSVCPDHNCEAFGWLQHEGDWAACLPAGVVVRMAE
ncbi:NusG domain II-containing protein [Ruminococcaceae bacterium OttesenSCG-928-A16]|nr:NusG domain II-containing protein [Ruminococcaceae bacterium OttesenSCG-928-A16]